MALSKGRAIWVRQEDWVIRLFLAIKSKLKTLQSPNQRYANRALHHVFDSILEGGVIFGLLKG